MPVIQKVCLNNIETCTACELRKTRKRVVQGRGTTQATFMIIGDYPNRDAEEANHPFSGAVGTILWDQLMPILGLDRLAIYYTNAVKCCPGKGKIKLINVKICKYYLLEEIRQVRPTHILTLGQYALSALLEKGIKYADLPTTFDYTLEDMTIKVMSTYHPIFTATKLDHLPYHQKDFQNFRKHMNGLPMYREEGTYTIITNLDALKELRTYLQQKRLAAVDIETDKIAGNFITGVSFCAEEGKAYFVPILKESHTEYYTFRKKEKSITFGEDIAIWTTKEYPSVVDIMKEILGDLNISKIFQNGDFDIKILHKHGYEVKGFFFDTLVASNMINENLDTHSLKGLAYLHLNFPYYERELVPFLKAIPTKIEKNYMAIPLDTLGKYGAMDADATLQVYRYQQARSLEEPGYRDLMYNYIMPSREIWTKATITGVKINKDKVAELQKSYGEDLKNLELQIWDMAGKKFNIKASAQLADVLFRKLAIPSHKKFTKTGQVSTNKDDLEPLEDDYPIIKQVLEYKKKEKLKSTYLDGAMQLCDANGRIHTNFKVNGTETGRLCVPVKNKILTKRGWKKYNELIIGELILGYNISEEKYVWTKLKNVHVSKGDIGLIRSNKSHDNKYRKGLWCTKDHTWLVRNKSMEVLGLAKAEHIPRKYRLVLLPQQKFPDIAKNTSILTEYEAGLLGWYLTNGFLTGRKTYGLGINLLKKRSITILNDLVQGKEHTVHKYKSPFKNDNRYITSVHISNKIFNRIYEIYKKTSPEELILNLSEKVRQVLFAMMLEGDGSMRRNVKRYDRFGALKTQPKRTCEYFELLSVSLGQPYSTHESLTIKGRKPFMNYYLLQNEKIAYKDSKWKAEIFDVDVWCPETDTGTWVMKQDNEIAVTGNSSSNPNLQNIPRDSDIRSIFCAEEGYSLVAIDFSQLELRIMAAFSGEPKFRYVYFNGLDLHSSTAASLHNVALEDVVKKQRDVGKTVNFGIIYLISKYGLAKKLKIDELAADKIILDFYSGHPYIYNWIEGVKAHIRRERKINNIFGRIRRFPYYDLEKYTGGLIRQGVNFPIQSTGADMTTIATLRTDKICNKFDYNDVRLLLNVHDELLFEVRDKYLSEFVPQAVEVMEQPYFPTDIPFIADSSIMKEWKK